MIRNILLMLLLLPGIANALEISTSSTNLGIGTTSTTNQLGVVMGLAVGSTSVNTTAPVGGIITDGNVGIGSTNPGTSLDTLGTIRATALTTTLTNTPQLGLYPIQTNDSHYTIGVPADGDNVNNDNLVFSSGVNLSTPEMVITPGGNVGIGSNTPGQTLDINGNARLSGADFIFLGTDNKAKIGASASTTPDIDFFVNGSQRMVIQNGGNVGIGTITPGANFEIRGSERVGGTTGLFFGDDTNTKIIPTSATGGNLQLVTGGSARLTVGFAVGIGTTSPAGKFEIEGGNVGIGTANNGLGVFAIGNASSHAGQAGCWTTGGAAGFCTTIVGASGGCTCTGL